MRISKVNNSQAPLPLPLSNTWSKYTSKPANSENLSEFKPKDKTLDDSSKARECAKLD